LFSDFCLVVMAGLDPAIPASLALFSSMSDNLSYYQYFSRVSSVYADGRVKPGHDEEAESSERRGQPGYRFERRDFAC
jgi:hypothetical protein